MCHTRTRGIPREWHGYTDVVFTPPTYCRLLASSTHFIIMPGLNACGLQSKLLITLLWQSLSLLSQCSEHVTIPHNFRICVCATHARVVSHVNDTDILTSCSPHPLIVDCLLAPPTLLLCLGWIRVGCKVGF